MTHKCKMNILSCIFKPLLVLLLIFGAFSLVYLRSSFLKLEYSLGDLEKRKMDCLKERKILLAEKTGLLSFAKLEVSQSEDESFILPDRVKVIHLSNEKRDLPQRASLEKR
jgi:hypothetical protein